MRIASAAFAFALLAAASLSACAATSAPPSAPSKLVVLAGPRDVLRHDQYHYAPVVRAGDLVVLSGIPAGRGTDAESKIRIMFDEAERELAAVGATFADVVELTTFHSHVQTTEELERAFDTFAKVHAERFTPPYPAWTAIGNAVLLNNDAVVEMRIVAVVGAGRGARLERRATSP
jgi:enamine deaminase RidA (YjgF/YER057c/UK114 family)